MTWTAPTPDPVDGPKTGPDRPMLEAYLGYQRRTLLNICAGLTAEQLAMRPLPSNLSLLGLVRHMAKVERIWFRIRAAGEPIEPFFDAELGKDHDFDVIDPNQAEQAIAELIAETEAATAAAAGLDFEHPIEAKVWNATISLRMVYVHMIGEYARHNGHADLIREAIDGVTDR
jgi:uncharacterized damage-inducible protein DinB